MGGIVALDQALVSHEEDVKLGFSAEEAIALRAAEVAQARFEHDLKMSLAEFKWEVRGGRMYSAEYKRYFDEIIDPPPERRAASYVPLAPHVLQNLRDAQRLLMGGYVDQLLILSPSIDFKGEGSTKGQCYRMRRIGDQIYVTCTDHSEDAGKMMAEVRALYGLTSEAPLGGNTINGGGIFGSSRDDVPSRGEAAAVIRSLGNEALAQQYEQADYRLAAGESTQRYLAELIRQEVESIRTALASSGIDVSSDPQAAFRVANRYAEERLLYIKEVTSRGGADGTDQDSARAEAMARAIASETRPASWDAWSYRVLANSTPDPVAVSRTVTSALVNTAVIDSIRYRVDSHYRFLKDAEADRGYSASKPSPVSVQREQAYRHGGSQNVSQQSTWDSPHILRGVVRSHIFGSELLSGRELQAVRADVSKFLDHPRTVVREEAKWIDRSLVTREVFNVLAEADRAFTRGVRSSLQVDRALETLTRTLHSVPDRAVPSELGRALRRFSSSATSESDPSRTVRSEKTLRMMRNLSEVVHGLSVSGHGMSRTAGKVALLKMSRLEAAAVRVAAALKRSIEQQRRLAVRVWKRLSLEDRRALRRQERVLAERLRRHLDRIERVRSMRASLRRLARSEARVRTRLRALRLRIDRGRARGMRRSVGRYSKSTDNASLRARERSLLARLLRIKEQREKLLKERPLQRVSPEQLARISALRRAFRPAGVSLRRVDDSAKLSLSMLGGALRRSIRSWIQRGFGSRHDRICLRARLKRALAISRNSNRLHERLVMALAALESGERISAELLHRSLELLLEEMSDGALMDARPKSTLKRSKDRTLKRSRKKPSEGEKVPSQPDVPPSQPMSANAPEGVINLATGHAIKATGGPSRSLDVVQSREDDDEERPPLFP